jgi:hypothetical protein
VQLSFCCPSKQQTLAATYTYRTQQLAYQHALHSAEKKRALHHTEEPSNTSYGPRRIGQNTAKPHSTLHRPSCLGQSLQNTWHRCWRNVTPLDVENFFKTGVVDCNGSVGSVPIAVWRPH